MRGKNVFQWLIFWKKPPPPSMEDGNSESSPYALVEKQKDRAVLAFCIGIAAIFWLFNKLSHQFPTETQFNIRYELPKGWAFNMAPPDILKASVDLQGWNLLFGTTRELTFRVREDTQSVISTAEIREAIAHQLGPNAKIGWTSVDQISIRLEEEHRRILAIEVNTDSMRFAKGYQLANPVRIAPNLVEVRGPASLIATLRSIQTSPLQFDSLKESVNSLIAITPHPLLRYEVASVNAFVEVEQFTEKSMFLPIEIRNAPARSRVFPNLVKLSCNVGLSQYQKVNPQDFVVEVDLKNVKIKPDNNSLPLIVAKQPDFVRNVKCAPNVVDFYFER